MFPKSFVFVSSDESTFLFMHLQCPLYILWQTAEWHSEWLDFQNAWLTALLSTNYPCCAMNLCSSSKVSMDYFSASLIIAPNALINVGLCGYCVTICEKVTYFPRHYLNSLWNSLFSKATRTMKSNIICSNISLMWSLTLWQVQQTLHELTILLDDFTLGFLSMPLHLRSISIFYSLEGFFFKSRFSSLVSFRFFNYWKPPTKQGVLFKTSW